MYEVHRHPVLQKYRTHVCSGATLFQFFVIWLTYLPPLIIAFVTYGKLENTLKHLDPQFNEALLLCSSLHSLVKLLYL